MHSLPLKKGVDSGQGMSVLDYVSNPSTILSNTAGLVALGVLFSAVTFYAVSFVAFETSSVLFSVTFSGLETF